MTADTLDLETLRRFPDIEAPNLVAVDASDRLILDEAADLLAEAGAGAEPGAVVVINDHYSALTLGAVALHGASDVRVHQDMVTGERALGQNAAAAGLTGTFRSLDLVPELVDGARVVLLQLPRGLDALEEIAQLVAAHAHPDVRVVAGGRVKHMSRGMNDVLARSFTEVTASLGRQKSRVLHASGPRPAPTAPTYPRRAVDADRGLHVVAHGAAFAGPQVDVGSRYLLTFLDRMGPTASDALDLGCGTGVLATELASARPDLAVTATDASHAAVRSTAATLEANHLADRVTVVREDGLEDRPDASADLIVCNPPFHVGATLAPDAALRMLRGAARVLRDGGELWTVFNSRLAHAGALRRIVGPTEVMGDDGTFTVTRTVRPARRARRSA
ncbi:class I SAM-dependent methyltransferase [Litorihabitans aurantiacus]|uniref:16S RNA G1207 methylase RsmC n=1 Tax=Litorihabitans aurantiacus TaxID=1930061 RepID=A0AA37XHU8_9MICO|nr:methyltransferase [Litorihabitans aurantiacus]GMA33244.1 16S RNA G1207 methylase RsmC [Litorihabitans aurantiacus]